MRRLRTVVIAAVILAGCSKPQEPAKLIPLKDFFRNPEQTYFQLSPDGKYIALLMPYEKRLNIHVQAVGSKDIKRLTGVTDRDISQYFWKGNDRLLYLKDFGGDENFHLFGVDREGKEARDLTPYEGARVELVDQLVDSETDVLISTNQRNKPRCILSSPLRHDRERACHRGSGTAAPLPCGPLRPKCRPPRPLRPRPSSAAWCVSPRPTSL